MVETEPPTYKKWKAAILPFMYPQLTEKQVPDSPCHQIRFSKAEKIDNLKMMDERIEKIEHRKRKWRKR
jgi:hypothetical protein